MKSELSGECEVPSMSLCFSLRRCDQFCNFLDLFRLLGLLFRFATFHHLTTTPLLRSLDLIFWFLLSYSSWLLRQRGVLVFTSINLAWETLDSLDIVETKSSHLLTCLLNMFGTVVFLIFVGSIFQSFGAFQEKPKQLSFGFMGTFKSPLVLLLVCLSFISVSLGTILVWRCSTDLLFTIFDVSIIVW